MKARQAGDRQATDRIYLGRCMICGKALAGKPQPPYDSNYLAGGNPELHCANCNWDTQASGWVRDHDDADPQELAEEYC